ncbi:MAG: hypothetical protein J7J67_01915 [Thermoproteales archaeon]|nr:hypothetical protein [Thermoproteales archaeon]
MIKAYRARIETSLPNPRSFIIKPKVFCLKPDNTLQPLEPSDKRSMAEEDIPDFDSKFSETLLLSFVDLASGEYDVEVLEFDKNNECKKALEVYRITGSVNTFFAVFHDKEKGDKPVIVRSLSEISRMLGKSAEELQAILT